jgi:hypothetical protein
VTVAADRSLPPSIDEAARRRFEAAWLAGSPAPLEQFLPPPGHPAFLATLEELVLIELELAWKAVSCPDSPAGATQPLPLPLADYLKRFPVLNQPAIVRRLEEQEQRVRCRLGDSPAGAVPPGDKVGVALPGYEVLRELGHGGMGIVYLARQVKLDRLVALKMIKEHSPAEAEQERFRREAKAVARLQHPHIVQIFEVGEQQGLHFFSLEFCAGGNLDKKLRPDGGPAPLAAAEAARLVETLARAVQAAHDRGVIHRDLKPANVLLADDGTPKIADFGLARLLDSDAGPQAGTAGYILGTPSYMAPEQAGGDARQVGPAVDVYALGAVLYDCLTGQPPFGGQSAGETLLQVLTAEPVPPSVLRPDCPPALEAVCLKCLRKNAADRYPSARAVATDLRNFLDGRPLQGAVPSRGRRPQRRWRRLAVGAVLLGLVAVALAFGLNFRGGAKADEQKTILAGRARDILRQRCYRCHHGDKAPRKLRVLDLDSLCDETRKRRAVVPGNPDLSNVVSRAEDWSMPPGIDKGEAEPVPEDEIRILRDWIQAGAPPFPGRPD